MLKIYLLSWYLWHRHDEFPFYSSLRAVYYSKICLKYFLLIFHMFLNLQCVDCLLLWCGTRHPYVILDYQSFHMSLFIHHYGMYVRTYKRSETPFAILSPKSQWHKVTFLGIYNEQEVMSGDNVVDRFRYFLFIYKVLTENMCLSVITAQNPFSGRGPDWDFAWIIQPMTSYSF